MRFRLLSTLLLALCVSACSGAAVKPWQRATLARSDMQLDSHPLQTQFSEHIYFSKEAASGGRGFGGGGCGCN
jgi:hypothetical protein